MTKPITRMVAMLTLVLFASVMFVPSAEAASATIRSISTGKCVTTVSTMVFLSECNQSYQVWNINHVGNGFYTIQQNWSCIINHSGSLAMGGCSGQAAKWGIYFFSADGVARANSAGTSLCITAQGNDQLLLTPCAFENSQYFQIR